MLRMRMLRWMFVWIVLPVLLQAQRMTVEQYVEAYKALAMEEMIRTGVPAAIKLAQGIVETESGNSLLVKKSNNHFGIKCKENWTGETVSHDDDAQGECFRKYPTPEASYRDHSDFLRTRKHYQFLFQLDPTDYKAWAYGLKKAGYATNPQYPQMLIKYIEHYNLNQYSLLALELKQNGTNLAGTNATEVQPTTVPATVAAAPVNVATSNAGPASADDAEVGNTAALQNAVANPKAAPETAPSLQVPIAPALPATQALPQESRKVSYPEGVFTINETKVVFAAKGTSLLALATQYQVPLKYLFDFNDMKEQEVLPQAQLVYLQRKRRIGKDEFHIVQEGETLYDIAQQQGIRLEALREYNFLSGEQQPAPGEKLYLRMQAPQAPRLAGEKNKMSIPEKSAAASSPQVIIHVVKPKETLYSISKQYATSAEAILMWNKLSTPRLQEGMELMIFKH